MLGKEGEFMKLECTAEWDKASRPEQRAVGGGEVKRDSPRALLRKERGMLCNFRMMPGVIYKQRLWGMFHHTGSSAHALPAPRNYT